MSIFVVLIVSSVFITVLIVWRYGLDEQPVTGRLFDAVVRSVFAGLGTTVVILGIDTATRGYVDMFAPIAAIVTLAYSVIVSLITSGILEGLKQLSGQRGDSE